MGVKEDRDEINNSGWRAILRRMMTAQKPEGFIKLHPAGWMGEEVDARPAAGSGEYIYYRRGYAPLKFRNRDAADTHNEEVRNWEA